MLVLAKANMLANISSIRISATYVIFFTETSTSKNQSSQKILHVMLLLKVQQSYCFEFNR
jgi:hypothetical protein